MSSAASGLDGESLKRVGQNPRVAEAVTELTDDKVIPRTITGQELCSFLQADGLSEPKPSKPNAQTEWREREESNRAVFESRDADFRDAACHRNLILADDSVKAAVRGPGK